MLVYSAHFKGNDSEYLQESWALEIKCQLKCNLAVQRENSSLKSHIHLAKL